MQNDVRGPLRCFFFHLAAMLNTRMYLAVDILEHTAEIHRNVQNTGLHFLKTISFLGTFLIIPQIEAHLQKSPLLFL